jgi:hypothetical protein
MFGIMFGVMSSLGIIVLSDLSVVENLAFLLCSELQNPKLNQI